MLENPKNITRAVDLILISRNLERIADHATNIGEEVVFIEEGRNIKHHS
jgi:phosphate transport system protein